MSHNEYLDAEEQYDSCLSDLNSLTWEEHLENGAQNDTGGYGRSVRALGRSDDDYYGSTRRSSGLRGAAPAQRDRGRSGMGARGYGDISDLDSFVGDVDGVRVGGRPRRSQREYLGSNGLRSGYSSSSPDGSSSSKLEDGQPLRQRGINSRSTCHRRSYYPDSSTDDFSESDVGNRPVREADRLPTFRRHSLSPPRYGASIPRREAAMISRRGEAQLPFTRGTAPFSRTNRHSDVSSFDGDSTDEVKVDRSRGDRGHAAPAYQYGSRVDTIVRNRNDVRGGSNLPRGVMAAARHQGGGEDQRIWTNRRR